MTYREMLTTINELEAELLCWFTEDDLAALRFSTLTRLVNEGLLTYAPLDNLWVGQLTYNRIYGG